MPQKRIEFFRLLLEHLAWMKHQFFSGIRDSRKVGSLWGMMRGVRGVRNPIPQWWLSNDLGLGLLWCGFKGVQEDIPLEEASTLQIGSWHFHQYNAPVNISILVTDYLTQMGIKTVPQPPYSPDLAPCDFGYSPSSEAVVMRQLRRGKKLWRRSLTRSHKRNSVGTSKSCWNGTTSALQREEIPSKGTRVSCVYYQ